MPDPKKQRLKPVEREAAIVRSAIQFFAQYGFDGTTRELAHSLGVTQPLLYRYFPNKEALIDRVYKEVFVDGWKEEWELELKDRSLSLDERLCRFYAQYSRVILTYEWVRLFMFAGLKGLDFTARYLEFMRHKVLDLLAREIRASNGMDDDAGASAEEAELIWGLHASIYYLGVRKFIYDVPIPEDLEADIRLRVHAFLNGAPSAFARAAGIAMSGAIDTN